MDDLLIHHSDSSKLKARRAAPQCGDEYDSDIDDEDPDPEDPAESYPRSKLFVDLFSIHQYELSSLQHSRKLHSCELTNGARAFVEFRGGEDVSHCLG